MIDKKDLEIMISPDDGSKLVKKSTNTLTDLSDNHYNYKDGQYILLPKEKIYDKLEISLIDHEYFRKYKFSKQLEPMFINNYKTNDIKELNILPFIPPIIDKQSHFALDHGCGGGKMRNMIEDLGYNYIGVDNETGVDTVVGGGINFSKGATHIADLHRLPFLDNTFNFSFSYSVFEHCQNPFLAAKELFRTMKPQGISFIAVANLIPFHMDSFFHCTHFGILNLFKNVGFNVLQVAGANWNGYEAISSMGGLPGPKILRNSLSRILSISNKMLWRIRSYVKKRDTRSDELIRHNMMAGIMKAVLQKP